MLTLLKRLIILLSLIPTFSSGQDAVSPAPEKDTCWDERPAGFYNVTTFSVATFSGQFFNGMQTTAGYRFNPHLALGGGVGLERFTDQPLYDTVKANLSLLPVFVDLRYIILDRNVTPVIAVNGGYKFLLNIPSTEITHWTEDIFPGFLTNDYYVNDTYNRGGFFFTAEAGVKVKIWKRMSLYGSLDYSLWSVTGDHNTWVFSNVGGTITETYETSNIVAYTHAFAVRVGFCF